MIDIKTQNFIEKSREIHGDKYGYDKVRYVNNRTKVCITCPVHGDFWQTPEKHLLGRGCQKCGGTQKSSTESFVAKAEKIHHKKYKYDKVDYVNNQTKVIITCSIHGDFSQTPHNHLKGQGCPECGKELTAHNKFDEGGFVLEAIKVHGTKYGYENCGYKTLRECVDITCPCHGPFSQIAYLHLNGAGCPKCSRSANAEKKRKTLDKFISDSKKIHGDIYDYSNVSYVNAKSKVAIVCKKHGVFYQTPDNHLAGCGCPNCIQPYSKAEDEIFSYIKTLLGDEEITRHDRSVLDGKELDMYVPGKKTAIEYNGLYWHTIDVVKSINYHLDKQKKCNDNGIKLIHIFEDEYVNHKEIVLAKLRHLFGCNDLEKVYARKCGIKEISGSVSNDFMEVNHLQGPSNSSLYIGAYYGDLLVGVMSFKKRVGKNVWELTRFATDINKHCIGVGGKLFNYFVKTYNPSSVVSFADKRWTCNPQENLYTKLGFVFDSELKPDYRYYNPHDGLIRQHKFGFRKQILHKKYGLPLTMTESEMTKKLGYSKIYDCGLIRYVWTNKVPI